MVVKVSILSGGYKKTIEREMYFHRDPKMILKELIKKGYHVSQYLDIESSLSCWARTAKIEIANSCETFKKGGEIFYNNNDPQLNPDKKEIIKDFIRKYLINVVILEEGTNWIGEDRKLVKSVASVVRNENYLITRMRKGDSTKENQLEKILTYAEILSSEESEPINVYELSTKVLYEMPEKIRAVKNVSTSIKSMF